MSDSNLPTEVKKPSLPSTEIKQGQILKTALDNLTPDQKQELMGVAAHEALNIEVEQRHRMARHDAAREAIGDHIQTYHSLDKNGRTTRHTLTSDIETGAGKMKIESKSGATCFVASVAYGDFNHPDVVLLKEYRDSVLSHNAVGRLFINCYWRIGPFLAKAIGWSRILKGTARLFIKLFICYIRK